MTSKISLFNKGIYKSTVRRYIWGAVLYAIIIFLTTAFPILFSGMYAQTWEDPVNCYLLNREYLTLPLVYALVAPSVFILLIFRFIHSKKQGIFTHSLPVSRNAIFFSSVAAAITLMAIPVILNGAILCVMSFCGFGKLFNAYGCLVWTAYNLLAQVIMLSAALFAASLTGNSFAFVGINVFVHLIVNMMLSLLATLSTVFLYGFYNSGSIIAVTGELNFFVAILNLCNNYDYVNKVFYPFPWTKFAIIGAVAVVLFVVSFVLYKKRRVETAEDVAAYYILNPIFKYLLTLLASLGAFAIYSYELSEKILPCILTVLIVSAVVYFATEMVLKKSLRIWKAYKGYFAFLAAFAALISLFAFTSFFGFETRVPDVEDIESVAVAEYVPTYYDLYYVETPEAIEYARELHSELVAKENMYRIKNSDPKRNYVLSISYKLKNGRKLMREYEVTPEVQYDALSKCFECPGYKEANVSVLRGLDKEEIYSVELGYAQMNISEEEKRELLDCIREDIAELSYMEYVYKGWEMRLAFNTSSSINERGMPDRTREIHINGNYARTVRWLKLHGYEKSLWNPRNLDVCILTAAQYTEISSKEKEALASAAGVEYTVTSDYIRPTHAWLSGVRRFTGKEVDEIREFILSEGGAFEYGRDDAYYICTIDESDYISAICQLYDDSGISKFIK